LQSAFRPVRRAKRFAVQEKIACGGSTAALAFSGAFRFTYECLLFAAAKMS
jgi:hypothetical protein